MASRMRMNYRLPGQRFPQNVDRVTFKKSKELKLRDFVKERGNLKITPCLFEMSLVFECLKQSNYKETMCTEEVHNFNNCYLNALKESEEVKQRRKNPSKAIKSGNLIDVEINQMFQKYKLK